MKICWYYNIRSVNFFCYILAHTYFQRIDLETKAVQTVVGFHLVRFYGISTIIGYLMPNLFLHKQLYFRKFSLAWVCCFNLQQFYLKQFTLVKVRSLIIKTVLFQTNQFNISTQFSSLLPFDKTLSSATTPGKILSESDGNKCLFTFLKAATLL